MFRYNKLVSVVCCAALLPVLWFGHGSAACDGPTVRIPHEGSINASITLQCTGCSPRDRDGATWYLEGEDGPVGTGTLIVPVTENSGGSIYRCECDPNMECHIILVNPYFTMTFAPRGSALIRSGDTFTLVCEADGFPRPEPENFTLTKTSPTPVIHFQQQELVPTRSGVALTVTNASKERHSGQYHCIVNTVWSSGPMQPPLHGTNSTSTTVTVFEPPFIRSTTNFTVGVSLDSSEQLAATLECSVQSRDEAVTVLVQWVRDGQVLQSSAKYVITDEPISEAVGVLVYLLTVRKVTEDDLGAYECQLLSNISRSNPEAVRRVWITSRNESSTRSCDNIKYTVPLVVAIILLVVVTVYAICITLKYRRKAGFYGPASQFDHGNIPTNNFSFPNGNEPPTELTDPQEQDQSLTAAELANDIVSSRAADPYQLLPVPESYAQSSLTAVQPEKAEEREGCLIPMASTELSEQQQPAAEMESQSEDITRHRHPMPATAQLERTASSHSSRGEESPVFQAEVPRRLSQSSASTPQEVPQSPRRASPKKSRRLSQPESSSSPSPLPRIAALTAEGKKEPRKDRRRSSSSLKEIKEMVLQKRRGSERDDSEEPLI